jgi:SAM-dependent methyltransferase
MRATWTLQFIAPAVFLLSILSIHGPVMYAQRFGDPNIIAPDFPSPQGVIERMLQLARVRPGETVYDLGSGEGRIVITAARQFKARAVGIELSPELCRIANGRVKALGLEGQVKIVHANMLKVNLRPADVVTIYLLTSANDLLRPNLERDLRPGARVVSHDFEIRGWKPEAVEQVEAEGRPRTIYLYQMGTEK